MVPSKAIEVIVEAAQWLTNNPLNQKPERAPDGRPLMFAKTANLKAGYEGVYFGNTQQNSTIVLFDHANPTSTGDFVPTSYQDGDGHFVREEAYPPLGNGYSVDMHRLRSFTDKQLERMANNARRILEDRCET